MARWNVVYAVAAAGLFAVTSVAVLTVSYWWTGSDPPAESLDSAIGLSPLPMNLRLYPADVDPITGLRLQPMERSRDVTVNGVIRERFVRNDDHSLEHILLKPDEVHFASRETFYPEQPGELGWRPHIAQIYSPTSDRVVDEIVRRIDGTLDEHTLTSENGAKHVLGYGADGEKIIHELIVNAPDSTYGQPTLQEEDRWRDDALRTLSYSNVFDSKEKKRTITYWDDQHRPVKVTVPNAYGSHNGTMTTAYYPGTTVVRMQSEVDTSYNVAKYFRLDKTLDHVLKLSAGSTIVQYFDASGTKMLLEQWWNRTDKTDKGKTTSTYKIYSVDEYAAGELSRKIYLYDDNLVFDVYNVKINGTKYGEIDYTYDGATKTLKRALFWVGKADHVYDREEVHTPQDKIMAPAVSPDDMTMHVNPDEDEDLKQMLPDPNYGFGGWGH